MSYFGTAGDRTVAAMRDIVYDDCPVLLTSPATGGVVSDNFPVLGRHPLGKFVKTILLIQKLSLPLAVLWAYREDGRGATYICYNIRILHYFALTSQPFFCNSAVVVVIHFYSAPFNFAACTLYSIFN